MNITAEQVKELRELTGAGMMDCKKALVEADGDIDKATDLLRVSGIQTLKKKQGGVTDTSSYGKSCFTEVIDGKIITTCVTTYSDGRVIKTIKEVIQ